MVTTREDCAYVSNSTRMRRRERLHASNSTAIGCRPHIVFRVAAKYSRKRAGSPLSMQSIASRSNHAMYS